MSYFISFSRTSIEVFERFLRSAMCVVGDRAL